MTELRRLVRILSTVALAILRLSVRALWWRLRGWPLEDAVGRTARELLIELGPSYLKIGQILSTRRDILPRRIVEQLELLQDRIPPQSLSEAMPAIRAGIARPLDEVFRTIDETPVAGASIASVYCGWLLDGRKVAIKVRRPGIGMRVAADLRLLRRGASLLEKIPGMRAMPLHSLVEGVGEAIAQQLDFRREGRMCRRLGERFGSDQVHVPVVVEELSSESVLIMEFLDETHAGQNNDVEKAVESALKVLYTMIFVEGLVHCDLHPGNLFLLEDGEIALLDFGFVVELSDDARASFAEFFHAMSENEGAECARIAIEMATFRSPRFDETSFTVAAIELVERFSGATAADFSVAEFVARLIDLQRRHGLRSTTEFTMAIVALLVFEGTVKRFRPDLDFQTPASPYILPTLLRATGTDGVSSFQGLGCGA
jgi:ubiquinone biosynthesis protein